MLRWLIILLFLLPARGIAQEVDLLLPASPVVTGTAFQVQFIVKEPGDIIKLVPPSFDSFRVVSGPNYHTGTTSAGGREQKIQNITFTLVPVYTGLLRIKPLLIQYRDGRELQSSFRDIVVVPQQKASYRTRNSYTDGKLYRPLSLKNEESLINDNLFVRTLVDKRNVYEGEPVTVSFVLYSRLQSSSEAVRSPSFYGFGVIDMLRIDEPHLSVDTVDGKIYNTAILRKVQLFPERSGQLSIDALHVDNVIEFEDSSTKQKRTITKTLVTEPVMIRVKPLKSPKPDLFQGAVGQFQISSFSDTTPSSAGKGANFIVTIKGKGNFYQFLEPKVEWPAGLESFEPQVIDEIDKTTVPVSRKRTFIYPVTSSKAGRYLVPAISFTYFDPLSQSYHTATSEPVAVHIQPAAAAVAKKRPENRSKAWPYLVFLLASVIAGAWYRTRKKKGKMTAVSSPVPIATDYGAQLDILASSGLSQKQLCVEVQKLMQRMQNEKGEKLPDFHHKAIGAFHRYCEMLIYTNASEEQRATIIRKAKELLSEAPHHSAYL